MITLDQRGCGLGKTTDGIYKRIRANIQRNINTLIVVPGIKLQEQYEKIDLPIEVINSEIYNKYHYKFKTTVSALVSSMRDGENIIIITHQTFMMMPKDCGYKGNYDLIIDEALNEIIKISDIRSEKSAILLGLGKLFDFTSKIEREIVSISQEDDINWYKLVRVTDPGISLLNESESFTNMTDPNFISYTTGNGWAVLTQEKEGRAKIISVLDPHLLEGWKDIMIAAAAFEYTKMYYWMKSFGLQTRTISEFIPHDRNIRLHCDSRIGQRLNNPSFSDKGFVFSNSLRKKHPEMIENYHEYINKHRTGKIITLRNNDEKKRSLPDEVILSHNIHGLNNFTEFTNVNLESALNPDPVKERFMRDMWLSMKSKAEQDRLILHFTSSYLFYQMIMRTKLRDWEYFGDVVDVFTPDQAIAASFVDYFNPDCIEVREMNLLSGLQVNSNLPGRPIKEDKLTKSERNKKAYEKKKGTNSVKKPL